MAKLRKMESQDKKTLLRILKLIHRYWFWVFCSLILAIITVILTLYVPIMSGKAIDCIVGSGQVDFESLFVILKKLAIVVCFTALAQWLMSHINNHVTYHVVEDMRIKAFDHVQQLPIGYLDAHPSGDLLSRLMSDIDQFSEGLLMGFTQLFTGVMTIIGTLFFMFSINSMIALVVVVMTPLSFVVAGFIAKRTYAMFKRQSQTRGELSAFSDEMISGLKVVKVFSHEAKAQQEFERINAQLAVDSLQATFFSSLVNPATRFVNALVYACTGAIGAILSIEGYLSIGQLTSFLSYANQYTKPFNEISGVVTELQNALASASRVFELIDEPPLAMDDKDAYQLRQAKGEIDLKHVSFSYDKSKHLIEDLNLHVKSGERVAIVGPTGCGKSTLINLLMRFYDIDSGKLLIDGHDQKAITRHSLRENFGMVLQDTWLKAATIKENIAYGKPDASDEEIIEAAKKAHCHSFIQKLNDGYDTLLAEDGGSLSQGQKQLLCIARVLLRLPPMLILDEATSNIDTRTELHIQNAFANMMKGRTSFIVAHRLSTIKEADVILVMRDGKIIEQGNHEELLAKNGFYTQLYQAQFVKINE